MRSVLKSVSLYVWLYLVIFIILINCLMAEERQPDYAGKKMRTRKGREIMAFRGVPYALDPIDNLRFEDPKPIRLERRNLKYDSGRCLERTVDPHEDDIFGVDECLCMNIYTPIIFDGTQLDILPKYPVMVWIHGGGFQNGYSYYYTPTYLMDHDLVFVTLSYRLGPFGFLSTGDDVIPGNFGLKDQLLALKWINEYIFMFGGDADSITIFGHGAGAASAHYLMMNPQAKGLFHRVIAQSGSPFHPWAFDTPKMARETAAKIGKHVNCPLKDSYNFLQCIRQRKPEAILAAQTTVQGYDIYANPACKPVLESKDRNGSFVIREPLNMKYEVNVPLMTGVTTHEGALRAAALFGHEDETMLKNFREEFYSIIPILLGFDKSCSPRMQYKASQRIYEYYFGDKNLSEKTRFDLIQMLSDGLYVFGIENSFIAQMRDEKHAYYYHFAYQGPTSHSKLYGDVKRSYGVAHGDDLFYLFPLVDQLFPGVTMRKRDYEMVDIMTKMWYNFAKYGDPTYEPVSKPPIEWKSVQNNFAYLLIGGPRNMTMVKWPNLDLFKFWDSLPCRAGLAPGVRIPRDEL